MERNAEKKIIPVILGPTCSGKTGLSVWICKKIGGEIISADSRQVYKYMDVGTGKVPLDRVEFIDKKKDHWLLNEIPVWGYDLIEPGEYFSSYDFAVYGLDRLKHIVGKCKIPVITGGTGLYIDFLTGKIKNLYGPPDFKLRKKLEKKDLQELQEKVTSLNVEINRSDFQNKKRLVRVIEREISDKKDLNPLPYPKEVKYLFIGLRSTRDILYERADFWVEDIWRYNDIIDETKKLISMGFGDTHQIRGFIYGEAMKYIGGKYSREEAVKKTKYRMHSYIRRQQTYFKKNKDIKWFDINQDNFRQNVYNYINAGHG